MGITLKHMDIGAQDTRVMNFVANSQHDIWYQGRMLHKTLLSTDNGKMDSTIIACDRERYIGLLRAMFSTLRAEDSNYHDLVFGTSASEPNRKLYIKNKFLGRSRCGLWRAPYV